MNKFILLTTVLFTLVACSHGNCRAQKGEKNEMAPAAVTSVVPGGAAAEATMNPSPKTERVKVHKPDGSLQCGQGKAVALAEMQKQLKNIKVYTSENKNDGMMRIQVCGSPTGNSNVYEIDRKDLEAALKLGFKEWTIE